MRLGDHDQLANLIFHNGTTLEALDQLLGLDVVGTVSWFLLLII